MKTKIEKKELIIAPDSTPAGMINAAVSKGADLEKLEKLLLLQERYESNEARKAYYKAMTAFKANLPQIQKDKKANYAAGGSQVRYGWASLFNVVDKVTPRLSEYGLSMAWFHKQTEQGLTVTCRITHELGYSEETSLTAGADKTGCKNDLQALGSANSYLERYSFLALLGVATKDQDDDAKATGKPVELIDEKQLSQLLDVIDNNKISKPKLLVFLNVKKLEDLLKVDFEKTMISLQNIVKGGKP